MIEELKKATILGEQHLEENLKRLCIGCINNLQQENKQYKEVIDKAIEEIKKELKENNHLSYGVALSIIVMLNYYEEILKEVE